jgi:hypothetical protein
LVADLKLYNDQKNKLRYGYLMAVAMNVFRSLVWQLCIDISENSALSIIRLVMEAAGFSECPYVSTRQHGIMLQKRALSKYKKVLSGWNLVKMN